MTSAAHTPAVEASSARAYGWMAAAGVGMGIVPSGLWMAFVRVYNDEGFAGYAYPPSSNAAAVVVATIALVAAIAVAMGVLYALWLATWPAERRRAAWWLALAVPGLIALLRPPVWLLGTLWLFLSATLAVPPLWWARQAQGQTSHAEAAAHVTRGRRSAIGLTVLSHVVVWITVVAAARPLDPIEFAGIEAARGNAGPVVFREQAGGGGFDFVEQMTGAGTIAAARYVCGDMSATQILLGIWPPLAHWLVVPHQFSAPTERESWLIAAIAFVLSTMFWTPCVVLWVRFVGRAPRRLAEPA